MKASEYLGNDKQNIYFDIDLNSDTVAFINPILIENNKDKNIFLAAAIEKLNDFFDTVSTASDKKLEKLSYQINKENRVFLGYSKPFKNGKQVSNGHGPKKVELLVC